MQIDETVHGCSVAVVYLIVRLEIPKSNPDHLGATAFGCGHRPRYDRTGVYTALDERHPDAKVIVPPRADAVLSATADTDPTQRDRHIQAIAEKGRMAWQRDSGYNQRAGVEGQFARWKQVIGDGLRFHSDEAQATAIAAQVLNRMLDLGRPNSVRIA